MDTHTHIRQTNCQQIVQKGCKPSWFCKTVSVSAYWGNFLHYRNIAIFGISWGTVKNYLEVPNGREQSVHFWKASGINEGDMWGNGNLLIYLCLLVCDRPCMLMSSPVFNQRVDWETDKISVLVENIAKHWARPRQKRRERASETDVCMISEWRNDRVEHLAFCNFTMSPCTYYVLLGIKHSCSHMEDWMFFLSSCTLYIWAYEEDY